MLRIIIGFLLGFLATALVAHVLANADRRRSPCLSATYDFAVSTDQRLTSDNRHLQGAQRGAWADVKDFCSF